MVPLRVGSNPSWLCLRTICLDPQKEVSTFIRLGEGQRIDPCDPLRDPAAVLGVSKKERGGLAGLERGSVTYLTATELTDNELLMLGSGLGPRGSICISPGTCINL